MARETFLAFPLRIVHGMAATASRHDHIYQMIEQVLFTVPGERVMLPEFGTGVSRLIFEAENAELIAATQALISADLQRWLGDLISVRSVEVTIDDSRLSVDVRYELLETREVRRDLFVR